LPVGAIRLRFATEDAIAPYGLENLRDTFEAVVINPIHLTQLFLPAMKARGRGAFVFITSVRETHPEPGFAVPTTLRAATTEFAKALRLAP
jgi:3-oxoacyl-[acyl-carrier protein] reductase